MVVNRPATKLWCFLTVGGLVSSVGLMSETFLWRGGVPVLAILLLSNLIVGAATAALFLQAIIREQEKRQVAADRLSKIADMNHHVRNALAVVAFYGTQGGNATATQLVSHAVKRIEWALREILPRGWDLDVPESPLRAEDRRPVKCVLVRAAPE